MVNQVGVQTYPQDMVKRLYGGGGGGGEGNSNLGCRDTSLKIVSLLKNYKSEGGKSIHFWKGLCTDFSKILKSIL